jgi:hypothetical protein
MPPKAAPAEGRPKGADAPMNQSREAHHTARPLHSPEGASRPRFLRPTGPTRGMTSGNPASRWRGGTRVAGVGSSVGFRVGSSVGGNRLDHGGPGRDRQGCGACQRSSTRRRRVLPLPPTVADGRRGGRGSGQARSRHAAELAGCPIALDSGAAVPQLHHRSPGEPGGQYAGGRGLPPDPLRPNAGA